MEWSWGMSEYTECSNFQSSHRFNKIQQKIRDNLCKFVAEKKHPKKSQRVNKSTGQRVIGYGGFKKNRWKLGLNG